MAKYKKSKSLKGDLVIWVARKDKSKKVVARADSLEELNAILEARDSNKVQPRKEAQDEPESTKSKNPFRRRKAEE